MSVLRIIVLFLEITFPFESVSTHVTKICPVLTNKSKKKIWLQKYINKYLFIYITYFRYQFHQRSTGSPCAQKSHKRNKDWQLDCLFCSFGIWALESCSSHDDEIDPRFQRSPSWRSQSGASVDCQILPLSCSMRKKWTFHQLETSFGQVWVVIWIFKF